MNIWTNPWTKGCALPCNRQESRIDRHPVADVEACVRRSDLGAGEGLVGGPARGKQGAEVVDVQETLFPAEHQVRLAGDADDLDLGQGGMDGLAEGLAGGAGRNQQ